jgi:uncharacterized alkaline shock family protein YloU
LSIFNRTAVIIAGAVILAGAVITILAAVNANLPDFLRYGLFQTQLQSAADATGIAATGIIAVSAVIALLMIVMLLLEFGLSRRSVPLLISSTESGVTTVEKDSVCLLAEKTAANIHGIHDINCDLKDSAEGLVFTCRAWVYLGSDLVDVSGESQTKIKETVEQLTSLTVAKVNIDIKHKSADTKRLAVR